MVMGCVGRCPEIRRCVTSLWVVAARGVSRGTSAEGWTQSMDKPKVCVRRFQILVSHVAIFMVHLANALQTTSVKRASVPSSGDQVSRVEQIESVRMVSAFGRRVRLTVSRETTCHAEPPRLWALSLVLDRNSMDPARFSCH